MDVKTGFVAYLWGGDEEGGYTESGGWMDGKCGRAEDKRKAGTW